MPLFSTEKQEQTSSFSSILPSVSYCIFNTVWIFILHNDTNISSECIRLLFAARQGWSSHTLHLQEQGPHQGHYRVRIGLKTVNLTLNGRYASFDASLYNKKRVTFSQPQDLRRIPFLHQRLY